MKFLLDVHIAASIGRALAANGHDVLNAIDGYADWSDERLLDLAVREGRVLITEDRDFSDLVYRSAVPPPPGILYLLCDPIAQPELADRVLLVLANATVEGHMVVIQPSAVRYRPLPEKSHDA